MKNFPDNRQKAAVYEKVSQESIDIFKKYLESVKKKDFVIQDNYDFNQKIINVVRNYYLDLNSKKPTIGKQKRLLKKIAKLSGDLGPCIHGLGLSEIKLLGFYDIEHNHEKEGCISNYNDVYDYLDDFNHDLTILSVRATQASNKLEGLKSSKQKDVALDFIQELKQIFKDVTGKERKCAKVDGEKNKGEFVDFVEIISKELNLGIINIASKIDQTTNLGEND